ncbi:LuxR C-terminal-related transcriptional regulator [Taibaiella helva]|uniref:LuxR C-terminal-related transcriptional regulator n=1 Tax=Taibaiella helva TaxID=2301235 RepID=UPI000E576B6C|nr:response regulator transcription factor [Taibaiella helva]
MSITAGILDDHPVVVEGILRMFAGHKDISIQHIWYTAKAFYDDLEQGIKPQVLLLDILLPDTNGDIVAQQLHKSNPEIKILAISVLDSAISANTMLRIGCLGYIMKHARFEEWEKAILAVASDQQYIEPTLENKIATLGAGRTREASVKTTLSPREKEVLQMIASGKSKKEIAQELGISVNTVKQYQFNISLKLEVNSTAALVRHALRTGLAE